MLLFVTWIALLLLSSIATSNEAQLHARAEECASNFVLCNPKGASSVDLPAVGSALSSLYLDLLGSIQGVHKHKRVVDIHHPPTHSLYSRASKIGICCMFLYFMSDGSPVSCVDALRRCHWNRLPTAQRFVHTFLLRMYAIIYLTHAQVISSPISFNTPMQDKFTTNFLFPGGAFGTIVTGNYTSPTGDKVNLLSGEYTLADGLQGNIYGVASGLLSLPNIATLVLPTQYTAAGIGSAIPLTALGQVITDTTTIAGTTVEPSTIAPLTINPSVVNGSTVAQGTTEPGTIIPGTTVPAKTSTVISKIAAPSVTSKGAASFLIPGSAIMVGVIVSTLFEL